MGVKNMMKRSIFGGSTIKRLMGFDKIKQDGDMLRKATASIFNTHSQPLQPETFEACLQRLNLSEADVQKRMRASWQIIIFMLSFSAGLFLYAIYMWSQKWYLAALSCCVLATILIAYAFREHFNYFQMKQRRLGCTVGEWCKYIVGMGAK